LEVTGTLKKLPLEWVARLRPRKFGNVLPGEVATCRQASCLLSPSHATTQALIALRGALRATDGLGKPSGDTQPSLRKISSNFCQLTKEALQTCMLSMQDLVERQTFRPLTLGTALG